MQDQSEELVSDLVLTLLERFGTCRLRVSGTSMLPTIQPGDILLIRTLEPSAVAVGDVVLFRRGGRLFAHRVVEMSPSPAPRIVVTCGDAHTANDPPLDPALLLGRVEGLRRNGIEMRPPPAPRRLVAIVSAGFLRRAFSIRGYASRAVAVVSGDNRRSSRPGAPR